MELEQILEKAVKLNASDIFIVAGCQLGLKINGEIIRQGDRALKPADTYDYVKKIYNLAGRENADEHIASGDDDFALSIAGVGRFRINVYKQRGSVAAIMRVVLFKARDYNELGIPSSVMELCRRMGGLVLVTGPAGSGKSTTLACLIDKINKTRDGHIMTLEDPIEFLHTHEKCIVSQREISVDTEGYARGLKSALRQAPDVILIGEMRDVETINTAITAAETGHLVLSTLHTLGAANAIDRIIDIFPPQQQGQVRTQLAMVLQAVVSQQLLPSVNRKRVAAFEVMMVDNAVRNLIRESKMHQIDSILHAGREYGMQSMEQSLIQLFKQGIVSKDEVLTHCINIDSMTRQLERLL